MTSTQCIAESIFDDLCRQRQSDIDKALVAAAQTGFTTPIIFRRVHYTTFGGLFNVGTWLKVDIKTDSSLKHVYVLPPVAPLFLSSNALSSSAVVPHIVKLERLELDPRTDELLKIAPFMAAEDANSDKIKILVTISTLVDNADCEKQPASAYRHDNMVLNIGRSFFEKDESWSASGCVNFALFSWFAKPKQGGYIKI